MDRNTLIGLGLIGVILMVFTYINQPSPEEIQRQQEIELQELEKRKALVEEETTSTEEVAQVIEHLSDSIDTSSISSPAISTPQAFKNETLVIENDKLKVELNTLGGGVTRVFLKEHQTYEAFRTNEGTENITPLQLFHSEKSTNQLSFPLNGTDYNSGDHPFEIVKKTEDYLELKQTIKSGKSISFIYFLPDGKYNLSYEIKMNGLEGDVLAENVQLKWNTELLKTERLLSEQRRISTVFFEDTEDAFDYLSETSDDEEYMENDLKWVAFKQSYFSTIMIPDQPFRGNGSRLAITNYKENAPKDSTHIKKYDASLNLNIGNTGNGSAKLTWFFGPNDYDLLASYNQNLENIVNLGWGLFRWVNVYAIQPIFDWLMGTGVHIGLAIFLLTLIVKLALTPIQWKMYASSAKMRILKPEIDDLNEKYPNKDDAMKKQMEMMTLYRESGASPLAGCLPMLIQIPILFAVFRFFPSSFLLRQEGFLWAEDLSSYDSVLDLGFEIPFYGDHISLFTLLMAVTTLFYTVLNSSNMQQPQQPGMPNMKLIMYIFPFMMIFFFNNFASGLSYYYFISTLISILTMVMIKNFFVDEDKLKAKMAARKAEKQGDNSGKKGSKSKFQERLEQMQKMQQEKLKQKQKK